MLGIKLAQVSHKGGVIEAQKFANAFKCGQPEQLVSIVHRFMEHHGTCPDRVMIVDSEKHLIACDHEGLERVECLQVDRGFIFDYLHRLDQPAHVDMSVLDAGEIGVAQ